LGDEVPDGGTKRCQERRPPKKRRSPRRNRNTL